MENKRDKQVPLGHGATAYEAAAAPTAQHLQGLTAAEVAASRAAHGANVLTQREPTPWWRRLLEKFTDPLIVILLVAAVLSVGISFYEYFGLGSDATAFFEPVGIIVAIALATGLAFWFEYQADREFALLSQLNDQDPVRVIRDGHETQVPRSELVVGDIVILTTGDEIPADGQLLEATQMQVDESTLTGEPVCHKGTLATDGDPDATYPSDCVLRGTKLLEGHGIMCVTAVGDNTEAGHVFTETQIDSSIRTPLNEQLDRLGMLISQTSYAIAALIVVGRVVEWIATDCGAVVSYAFLAYLLQSLMLAVTLIVVAVPEGLPMAVTLSLAYSMRRMLKTNNLVRRMHACETMGATTVICTDKTGTLTQNQMHVIEIVRHDAQPAIVDDDIALNIAVNSTAALDGNKVMGNPTEGALLLWLREQGVDYSGLRLSAHVVEEIPFSTERKYMATRIQTHDGNTTLLIKGAPEIVMAMCHGGEQGQGLSGEKADAALNERLLSWQQRGLRTLALAHARDDERPQIDALTAIADPVRPDVPEAVKRCLEAGIDVKVVTGDNAATANEIARQIGLMSTPASSDEGQTSTGAMTIAQQGSRLSRATLPCPIITGPELAAMSDEALCARAESIVIVARARPLDKLRLVQALQARGQVVAVTGDGTNDAPALKAAHVGLSMGDGTAVAKEASDITIIDNSFASIGRAVMWGRSLYRNIQRFILFQMTVNVCACFTVLAGTFMGTDAPLTVTQMLWVNLIMDTFAAMALASLPPTAAVMHEKSRDRRRFIISKPMWQFIIAVGGLFFVILTALLWLFEHADVSSASDFLTLVGSGQRWQHNDLTPFELSFFFTAFVMLQFWNLFNARAFLTGRSAFDLRGCRGFLTIVAIIFLGQILIVQFGGAMFNVVPLGWDEWLTIIIATAPILLIGEGVRFFKGFLNHRRRSLS